MTLNKYIHNKELHIHFVGISGIGMSSLAKIMKLKKYTVSGCDRNINIKTAQNLKNIGCKIVQNMNNPCIEHENNQSGSKIDIVIYSSAIKKDHPEIIYAQKKNIPIFHRSELLAELSKQNFTIAISGSHGKTTTSSLISFILLKANLDPTIVIGGYLNNIDSNAHLGLSNILVVEADESDRSLINLHPNITVITNIDLEHLDIYKDIEDIKDTFNKFMCKLPSNGESILCVDNENARDLIKYNKTNKCQINTLTYSSTEKNPNNANIYAKNIKLYKNHSIFDICISLRVLNGKNTYNNKDNNVHKNIFLNLPGEHNIQNALAAITIGLRLNVPMDNIMLALKEFKGIDRRFTHRLSYKGAGIYDDYAHHPTEIFNALLVAKNKVNNKLTIIFQPHKYTRTKRLYDDFINVFSNSPIDNLIITDIYPGDEQYNEEINSTLINKFIMDIGKSNKNINVAYIKKDMEFLSLKTYLSNNISHDDLVLILGAGEISNLYKYLY